jgi:hypothetical protein
LEDEALRWRCCVVEVLLLVLCPQISLFLCATLYLYSWACCLMLECTIFSLWFCVNNCICISIIFFS